MDKALQKVTPSPDITDPGQWKGIASNNPLKVQVFFSSKGLFQNSPKRQKNMWFVFISLQAIPTLITLALGEAKFPRGNFWSPHPWTLQPSDTKATTAQMPKQLDEFLGGGFKYSIFHFHPYLGKWSSLTNILQMGWNHQPDLILLF